LCEGREIRSLARMFNFPCVEYVVNDGGETAQSPESLRIDFHCTSRVQTIGALGKLLH